MSNPSTESIFFRLLTEKPFLLADGATGTNLFARGLQSGDAPELWNVDHPDRVAAHYQSFIDAGSDLILTNSFGGTGYRLKLHKAQDRVAELNEAAARILRECADKSERPLVVAGSMGPTGEILEPAGTLSLAEARDAFAEQAIALERGGADVLWIETISSLEEMQAAIEGARETRLPVVVTMSIDTNGRTMMGVTPADVVNQLQGMSHPPHAVGSNCGLGASEVVASILNFSTATAKSTAKPILIAKGNCGIPEWVEGEVRYNGTPELMARYATMAYDAGARIIGGCCGTRPDHIAKMRHALDQHVADNLPSATPDLALIESELGEVSSGAQAQLKGDSSVEGGAAPGARQRSGRSRRKK